MTTKNPRLTITLQPSLAAQLRELSRLTGNSQSALIAELLEGSAPVFDRVIAVLGAAQRVKEDLRGKLTADMDTAQKRIEVQLGLSMDALDDAARPLLEQAELIERRRVTTPAGDAKRPRTGAAAGVGAKRTPISNRGVRYDLNATTTIAQGASQIRPKPRKHGGNGTGGKGLHQVASEGHEK